VGPRRKPKSRRGNPGNGRTIDIDHGPRRSCRELDVGPRSLRRDRVKLDIFGDVVLVIQCQTSRQGLKTRVTYRVCVLSGR
jgi:hypothetical protein